jgi:hypothetical protein
MRVHSSPGLGGLHTPNGAAGSTRRTAGSSHLEGEGMEGRTRGGRKAQLLSAGSGAPKLRRNRRTRAIAGYGGWVPRWR